MALNSTGAISLGGTTTGQSVAVELGKSATATISLNDTAVRTLAGVASGAISLYNLYGKSNGPYWIGLLQGSSTTIGLGITLDTSANVYVTGYSISGASAVLQTVKYNNSGVVQWQRKLIDSVSNTGAGYSIAVDSSNNVYAIGYSGTYAIQLVKYDATGAIQWQRKISGTGSSFGNGITVDSSNNVYVVGQAAVSSVDQWVIAKYNTAGTIQWQRTLATVGGAANEVAVSSSGDIYVVGSGSISSIACIQTAKYDSSGTIQWQRTIDSVSSSSSATGNGIAVDSSGNVYITGYVQSGSGLDIYTAKYNTSGTIQWQRRLIGAGSSSDFAHSIALDSSNNVYVAGTTNTSGSYNIQIIKYDTSGTIQWQRSLTNTQYAYGIAVDLSGDIYINGYSQVTPTASFLIAKLPGDGSLTGTYTVGGYSMTYAASSLSGGAYNLNDAASYLTSSASSFTDAASSLTDAASSLTSSVTTL
jgi:sugar lactone lactonase YvrE